MVSDETDRGAKISVLDHKLINTCRKGVNNRRERCSPQIFFYDAEKLRVIAH